jgi:hypothetical protein
VEKGERAYAQWGRLAVFFTPAIVSGTIVMFWFVRHRRRTAAKRASP